MIQRRCRQCWTTCHILSDSCSTSSQSLTYHNIFGKFSISGMNFNWGQPINCLQVFPTKSLLERLQPASMCMWTRTEFTVRILETNIIMCSVAPPWHHHVLQAYIHVATDNNLQLAMIWQGYFKNTHDSPVCCFLRDWLQKSIFSNMWNSILKLLGVGIIDTF